MDTQELIEKYLQNKLTESQQQEFRKRLEEEPQLAGELAEYRKSELAVRAAVRQDLHHRAKLALEEHSPKGKSFAIRRILSIAAGLLFLVLAGYLLFQQFYQPESPDMLFAQHFAIPPAPSLRAGESNADQQWAAAVESYSEQNFIQAIPQFETLLTSDNFKNLDQAKLLLGISYLSLDKYAEALAAFNGISIESSLHQDAEWYLALTHLKSGDTPAARKKLQLIASTPRHFKSREAKQILENL